MLASPRISGAALRSLARAARTRLGAAALYRTLRAELGIDRLPGLSDAMRGDVPLDTRALPGRPPRRPENAGLPMRTGSWAAGSSALVAAYAAGKASPSDVVERAFAAARALGARTPSVGPLLETAGEEARREADAAALRYKAGHSLGPIDGVPFAVKEQTAVRGFARRGGTSFADGAPQAEDATCVARLRAAGAIVIGTTPMTEYGMSPIGHNAHRTMPRNPHAPDRVAGGSSTGSGVAVATGLVPFAMGADGGGSIRIPSALNGVFGIKPTWGRVSRHGDLSTGSVAHLGPLACSSVDLAHVLEIIAGRDANDPETRDAPTLEPGALVGALGRGVRGLRIGVTEGEWADAAPAIARAGEEALRMLEQEGAALVPVRIAHARYAAAIGYLAIGLEALAALRAEWRDHAHEMTHDLQVSFATLHQATAAEYVDAQRLRVGLRDEVARAFGNVDLLALPTTAKTAARVTDAQMQSGFLDAKTLDAYCRFTFLANLTGLPAASVPVGRDDANLPIGFQLVGDAWDEATVLAATAHLERIEVARAERPLAFVELLG